MILKCVDFSVGLFAKTSRCSKISDPLNRQINTRRKKKNSKDFDFRLHSYQLSLLRSNDWYTKEFYFKVILTNFNKYRLTSDLVPFTTRYELEKRHNIELMAHHGEENQNTEVCVSTTDTDAENTDSNDENEYFDPNPRRIDFDDFERNENTEKHGESNLSEDGCSKQNKKKSLGDEAYKKFVCDVCNKFFQKRWALNSHMLLHSGFVILINFLK